MTYFIRQCLTLNLQCNRKKELMKQAKKKEIIKSK